MTMQYFAKTPKKLIEVALPLDAINAACAYEKMPGIGAHPRGIHLWWARRPLAAARAVIFAQMVNDPSWRWDLEHPEEIPSNNLKASWAKSRKRLFSILEELVKWENIANEEVLEKARAEIRKSWQETCEVNKDHPQAAELFNPEKLPAFHDPFAGGGALPLEAQRLGLEAYASDLNPVAVLINKAMIEIPPKFAGRAPVNPDVKTNEDLLGRQWEGAQGLAEDVRYYARWMRDQARKRIGHLYPPIEITAEMAKERRDLKPLVGQKLTVIAWLWARTVKSPNPAFHLVDVPLASTFVLANKEGKEAYVQPIVEGNCYRFTVKVGAPPAEAQNGTKFTRANFRCLLSGAPISGDYIKAEGKAGRMGAKLMAIVAEGGRGRVYLPPTPEMESIATKAKPEWKPEGVLVDDPRAFTPTLYGLQTWSDLFTPRQLVTLATLSQLIQEAREQVYRDGTIERVSDDPQPLASSGIGAAAYSEAVGVYLAFALDRSADFSNSCTRWVPGNQKVMNLFGRNAIGMTWDFPEAGILHDTVGGFVPAAEFIADCILRLPQVGSGKATQNDAMSSEVASGKVVSTDPPYYDNVPYADLSDFFYVWLRASQKTVFPDLFATISVPKAEELVATSYRHGGKENAEEFFLSGMTRAMQTLAKQTHPAFPLTIYYAFKQAETDSDTGTVSTGWETFLDAVIRAGFAILGTWPLRSEQAYRMRGMDSNALASSVVLVCHSRSAASDTISRRVFLRELNQVLPQALDEMTKGAGDDRSPVAPVDLSQAIIGPGMAVFSKYAAVLEANGTPMSVRTALQLINRFLAEDDFDHETQFCLHWFEQYGWKEGKFGEADTLARAKGTSVDGVKRAGVLFAAGGIVRLLRWSEYLGEWNPETDTRLPIWEALHQLIRVFKTDGESGAGKVLATIQAKAEAMRQLAYRLYTRCERTGWAEDARAYNEIVTSWSAIESAAAKVPGPRQAELFDV
jgi:putative DNA methylase